MERRRIYILVNGILCFPGDANLWNVHGVTWLNTHTEHRAQNMLYFCTAIGRRFHQGRRVERLVKLLNAYRDWEIHGIGHSNGCDIWVRALAAADYPRVEALHLVSGACAADFEQNGLNGALVDGSLGRVSVYVGGKDRALRLASHSIGRLLGYGVLGLHGPKNVTGLAPEKVTVVSWPTFGHSTCWQPENFQRTMRYFVEQPIPVFRSDLAAGPIGHPPA